MTETFSNLNMMSGELEFPKPPENNHRLELIDGCYMETTHDIPPWNNIILRDANDKFKLIPFQIDRIRISNQDVAASCNWTNIALNKLAVHWNKMSNRKNNNISDTRQKCIYLDIKFKIFHLTQENRFVQCIEAFQNFSQNN